MHPVVMKNRHYYKAVSPRYRKFRRIFSEAYRTGTPISAKNRKMLERDPPLSRFAHMMEMVNMINRIHSFADGKILNKGEAGYLKPEKIDQVIYETAFQWHNMSGPGLAKCLEGWAEEYSSFGNFAE